MDQIDIPPAKSEEFASSQLAPGGEEDRQAQVGWHRISQCLNLGDADHRPLRSILDGCTLHLTRIPDEDLVGVRSASTRAWCFQR